MTTPPEPVRCYREYFANEATDPLEGEFGSADLLHRLHDNPYDQGYLFERAGISDTSYPAPYLFLQVKSGKYVMELLHSVALFPAQFGREVDWENNAYATLGDVVNGSHVATVQ